MESGIPVFVDTPRGTLAFNATAYGAGVPQFRLDGDSGFALTSAVRVAQDDLPGRDGTLLGDGLGKGMTANLRGSIRAASLADRALALQMLRGYLRSILRADGTLRWTPTGMTERRLTVRLLEDPLDAGPVVKTFSFSLVSPTANFCSSVQQTIDTSGLTGSIGGGIEFPFDFPVNFGDAGSSGTANVTNAGDTDAYPVVRVYGAIAAPVLRNQTTGKYVSLPGLTLNAGDYAEIDMRGETIVLNGSQSFSLIGSLDVAASSFWSLAPGVNVISLSGSSPDANAKARVIFRDTFA